MSYNHLKSIDGSSVDCKFEWQPDISRTISNDSETLDFDGRDYPVAFFGERKAESWDVAFTNDTDRDGDMWTELEKLITGAYSGAPAIWEDTFGTEITVLVSQATWKPIVSGSKTLRRISFHMIRVEDEGLSGS